MNPYKRTTCCLRHWPPQKTVQLEHLFSHKWKQCWVRTGLFANECLFFAQESLDNPYLIISICALYFNFSNISSYSQSLIIIQSTLTKIFWKPLSPQGSKAMSLPLSSTHSSHLILYLYNCFFIDLSCAIQWYGQHKVTDKNYLWRLSSQTLSF